jgi:hypothetical protein
MAILEKYQPHWVWGLAFVLVPVVLIAIGFVGVFIGSPIPLALAATSPKAALAIAVFGIALALYHGRRVPIEIAGTGAVITTLAFLLLRWLGT